MLLSRSTSTFCHLRNLLQVLYLPEEQYISSLSAYSLGVSLPYKPYEMGDTHVHFIRHVTPTPRSNELQHLHRNAAEGLSQNTYSS